MKLRGVPADPLSIAHTEASSAVVDTSRSAGMRLLGIPPEVPTLSFVGSPRRSVIGSNAASGRVRIVVVDIPPVTGVNYNRSATEPVGIEDGFSMSQVFVNQPTYTNPVGITDRIALGSTRANTDLVGVSDQFRIDPFRTATNPVGITDSGSFTQSDAGFVALDPDTGYLVLNGQRFRFSGTNGIHDIGSVDATNGNPYGAPVDSAPAPYGNNYITPHAQIDSYLVSAQALNVSVIHAGGTLIACGSANTIQPDLGTFNDAALDPLDYLVAQCATLGMKIYPVFLGNPEPGGPKWYCKENGITPDSTALAFFTNTTVINSFKAFVSHVLNHVNPYTGVKLKNDPTILCWETGGETGNYFTWTPAHAAWTDDIAHHIKVVEGAQQLVMDGHQITGAAEAEFTVKQQQYVDIYTNHTYENVTNPNVLANQIAKGVHEQGKAYVVGEWPWNNKDINGNTLQWNQTEFISVVEASPYIDGDSIWDLLASGDATHGATTWGDGFTLYRPGTTADMISRGTQLVDHSTAMASSRLPRVAIMDSQSTSVSSANVALTFDSTMWTPKENDVVLYWAACGSTAGTITVPAGWTNVLGGNTVVDSSQHIEYCIYHVVTAGEAAAGTLTYTATAIQTARQTSICGVVLRGVDAASIVDAAASTFGNTAVSPHVLAGVSGTGVQANSVVLSGVAKDGTGSYTPVDGWGRVTTIETNQTLWLLQRNARSVAATAVAATNITPSAADEYTSITVLVSESHALLGGSFLVAGADTITGGTFAAAGSDVFNGGAL